VSIRRFVRGTVPWESLEAVAREFADRYDQDDVRVSFLDADNWLSTPMVVDDEYFLKVVSSQNALVHALFTSARNLGAFSSGTEGFFEPYDDPLEMAGHELEATKRIRELGLNAPEPLEVFEVDGLAVLVLEFLPEFRPLNQLSAAEVEARAGDLFASLALMHENGFAHGDLRGENVLVSDGDLYFIDATNVTDENIESARAYDLASALAALEPLIGAEAVVNAALEEYTLDVWPTDPSGPAEALLRAQDFLGFVQIRPDHAFDAASLNGEIEKAATAAEDATR
jgi:hypothetical protein